MGDIMDDKYTRMKLSDLAMALDKVLDVVIERVDLDQESWSELYDLKLLIQYIIEE